MKRLPFVRLPIEHRARDIIGSSVEANVVVGRRDPFIYNPRLHSSKSKAQVRQAATVKLSVLMFLRHSGRRGPERASGVRNYIA